MALTESNIMLVAAGIFIMLVAYFSTARTAAFTGREIRPIMKIEKVVIFCFGVPAFVLGLTRILGLRWAG